MQAKSYLPFTRPLAFSSVNLGADGRREITSLSDNPIIIRVNCAGQQCFLWRAAGWPVRASPPTNFGTFASTLIGPAGIASTSSLNAPGGWVERRFESGP